MTLRRPTKNTIAGSWLYNLILWIISMIGWLKFWPAAIQMLLGRIPIPPPSCANRVKTAARDAARFHNRAVSIPSLLLVIAAAFPMHAQTPAKHAKKRSAKTTAAAKNKDTAPPAKKNVAAPPAVVAGEKQ